MIDLRSNRLGVTVGALALVGIGVGAGVFLGRQGGQDAPSAASEAGRRVLYYYDPMYPDQKFDKPGQSPFMNMALVAKYADEGAPAGAAAGVRIDPALTQNLGMRFAVAQMGTLGGDLAATAVVDFNQRDVAVVQARADGFVQRVYNRAPGDVLVAGAPLADLLIPSWGGAQGEYLAVRRTGEAALIQAARQRLLLLGMSDALITSVERSGRPRTVITVTSPIAGAIRTLSVRSGMTVTQGMTLTEVSGLSTVWLNAAIPEALAGQIRLGQAVEARLSAFPSERFTGRLTALLPEVSGDSRTLTGRVEMPNRGGRLRPGMYGQIVFGGGAGPALLVPSEAVIRTGTRDVVMLALADGRYQPAQVRVGREAGGQTEVLAGLSVGERIVASGQFLIDSEASLSGVEARPIGGASASPTPMAPMGAKP